MREALTAIPADWVQRFEEDGFCVAEAPLSPGWLLRLRQETDSLPPNRAGVRDLFRRMPLLGAFVRTPDIRSLVDPLLSPSAAAVRAILFDKNAQQNWGVAWHQDTTIAVAERRDAEGFGPWSTKAGVTHVTPPVEVLRRMATLRVHLDSADAQSGALQVLPGTQRLGKLTTEAIQDLPKREAVTSFIAAGGVMAMSPLLVHKSEKQTAEGSRRVLHIEFSNARLPAGLRWRDAF